MNNDFHGQFRELFGWIGLARITLATCTGDQLPVYQHTARVFQGDHCADRKTQLALR